MCAHVIPCIIEPRRRQSSRDRYEYDKNNGYSDSEDGDVLQEIGESVSTFLTEKLQDFGDMITGMYKLIMSD